MVVIVKGNKDGIDLLTMRIVNLLHLLGYDFSVKGAYKGLFTPTWENRIIINDNIPSGRMVIA